jgi:hypothetical protein
MREHSSNSPREPYAAPVLVRHGTLEELTAGLQKGTQGTTDQSSQPSG